MAQMAPWYKYGRNAEDNEGKGDMEEHYRQSHQAWHHVMIGQCARG